MEKKCRIWFSNKYDLDNVISKKDYREKVVNMVNNLLVAEDTFYEMNKGKLEDLVSYDNELIFPYCIGVTELRKIDNILTSKDLFNVDKLVYNGNCYSVLIKIIREVHLPGRFVLEVSSSKRIKIEVASNNNNDGIKYGFIIPYVYENKRMLNSIVDATYNTFVNIYKDYGH